MFQLRRIVWAVDPFDQEPRSGRAIAAVLKQLRTLGVKQIQPVYVSSSQYNFVHEPLAPLWLDDLRKNAVISIERFAKRSRFPAIAAPEVLEPSGLGTKNAVDNLVEFAKRNKADLIITQTHGRKGMQRLFLGSFAETLILRSPVPVLILNPHVPPVPKFQRILFPTDFDAHSLVLFKKVVDFASAARARVILFHSISFPMENYAGDSILVTRDYTYLLREYIEQEAEKAEKRAELWRKVATHAGVGFDFILDHKGGALWERIVTVASRQHAQLIALEAERGSAEAAIFGSVTRNLVRFAHCPVWVLRSHYSEKLMERLEPKRVPARATARAA